MKKKSDFGIVGLFCISGLFINSCVKYKQPQLTEYSSAQISLQVKVDSDNLEWVTKSVNMQRAYDTDLNKKVRNVLQYENINGEFGKLINEFKSLALASRETHIAEHEIRELCRNRSRHRRPGGNKLNKKFLWKYKNEEENEEWAKKFSSRN